MYWRFSVVGADEALRVPSLRLLRGWPLPIRQHSNRTELLASPGRTDLAQSRDFHSVVISFPSNTILAGSNESLPGFKRAPDVADLDDALTSFLPWLGEHALRSTIWSALFLDGADFDKPRRPWRDFSRSCRIRCHRAPPRAPKGRRRIVPKSSR